MSEKEYKTPAHAATFTYEEKRSVFIGDVMPCTREEEALAFIESIRARYPDARHHVYAYLLRENSKNRYSDDHEPQGTAGIPVLDVLRKGGLIDAVIVVTRYFGGVLLGAGGLVRAYTAAAAGAVKEAGVYYYRTYRPFELALSYPDYNKLLPTIESSEARILNTDFAEDVTLSLSIPEESYEELVGILTETTAGRAIVVAGDPVFDHD